MWKRVLTVLRVVLVFAAIWALKRELASTSLHRLPGLLRDYAPGQLFIALGCAVASFGVMASVEILALRDADDPAARQVPLATVAATSFVANALSQSIGVALLTGAAVRERSYARFGVNNVAIAQSTAFVTITATLGLLLAGAFALFAGPASLRVGAFAVDARIAAAFLLALVLAYLLWSLIGKRKGVGRGRWKLRRPSPRMVLFQIVLSTLDWIAVGTMLYALLPREHALTYGAVLGAYMVAQTAGMTSHVPAGAGVFELVILALLGRAGAAGDRSAVVASLVMFRVLYYLLPLLIAVVVAGVAEATRRTRSAPALEVVRASGR